MILFGVKAVWVLTWNRAVIFLAESKSEVYWERSKRWWCHYFIASKLCNRHFLYNDTLKQKGCLLPTILGKIVTFITALPSFAPVRPLSALSCSAATLILSCGWINIVPPCAFATTRWAGITSAWLRLYDIRLCILWITVAGNLTTMRAACALRWAAAEYVAQANWSEWTPVCPEPLQGSL